MYVVPFAFRLLDIMGIRPAGMLCMSGGRGDLQGASCNGCTASPIAQLVRAPH